MTNNRAVLVHSAAGGVGSMLVQMAKILGCSPVVAVVGSSHKVSACEALPPLPPPLPPLPSLPLPTPLPS